MNLRSKFSFSKAVNFNVNDRHSCLLLTKFSRYSIQTWYMKPSGIVSLHWFLANPWISYGAVCCRGQINFCQRFCKYWKLCLNSKTRCWLIFIVLFPKSYLALQSCLLQMRMATCQFCITKSSLMSWLFVSMMWYSSTLYRSSSCHRLVLVRPEGTCCLVCHHLYLLEALVIQFGLVLSRLEMLTSLQFRISCS